MNKEFINCEICGKRLIERKENGLYYFRFGQTSGENLIPVEIYVIGSIKIKCIRKSCNHWNEINHFPEV